MFQVANDYYDVDEFYSDDENTNNDSVIEDDEMLNQIEPCCSEVYDNSNLVIDANDSKLNSLRQQVAKLSSQLELGSIIHDESMFSAVIKQSLSSENSDQQSDSNVSSAHNDQACDNLVRHDVSNQLSFLKKVIKDKRKVLNSSNLPTDDMIAPEKSNHQPKPPQSNVSVVNNRRVRAVHYRPIVNEATEISTANSQEPQQQPQQQPPQAQPQPKQLQPLIMPSNYEHHHHQEYSGIPHQLPYRSTADSKVRPVQQLTSYDTNPNSLETSRSLPANRHIHHTHTNANPMPPRKPITGSKVGMQQKGRRLVAAANAVNTTNNTSTANNPTNPSNITTTAVNEHNNQPLSTAKALVIVAYMQQQRQESEKKVRRRPKKEPKPARSVWTKEPGHQYDEFTGFFSNFEAEAKRESAREFFLAKKKQQELERRREELELQCDYMKMVKKGPPRKAVITRVRREPRHMHQIEEKQEQREEEEEEEE
mmetsp:Transcript_29463/g.40470  ORF Transcript_29463/g.40470 Transcript_29463/m.40470 type:complete len:480 (+) Transcript_29463:6-1445(+)